MGQQVGGVVIHLVGPGLEQLGPADPAAGDHDRPQAGALGRRDVPHGVPDDDRLLRVEAVALDRHRQEVRLGLRLLDVAAGRGTREDVLRDADRRDHPVEVTLLAARREHDQEPGVVAGAQQVRGAGEGGEVGLEGLVLLAVPVHGLLVLAAGEVADQPRAGDADGRVALLHGDLVVAGRAQRPPPGEGVQVVGVEQGAVDVEEDARSQVSHGRPPAAAPAAVRRPAPGTRPGCRHRSGRARRR